MFNNTPVNIEKEKVNNIEENKNIIKPFLFLGENAQATAPTPTCHTLNMISQWADHVLDNANKLLFPLKSGKEDIFYAMNNDFNTITNISIQERILSDSFVSFCNALDQSILQKNGILNFFYVRESVYDMLYHNSNNNIITVMIGEVIKASRITSYKPQETAAVIDNYTGILSTYIISLINTGIDRAVNDIMCSVHTIPNQQELVRKLKETFIRKDCDIDIENAFWFSMGLCVKNSIYTDASISYDTIIKNIKNTLQDIPALCSTVYYDYKKYSNESKNQ